MAGQLVGLIRDKNATLETALAGLDQLRARMRALEQMGEPAEARALVDGLAGRLDALGAAQAAPRPARGAARRAAPPEGAALAERLAGLEEKRTAGLEATLARLAPLEAKLAALESGRDAEAAAGREALKRLEAKLEAQAAEAAAAKSELAALKAEAGGVRALGEQLTRVLAQKEALAETLVARVAALEAALAEQDPAPALARLAERLAALETAENPFAEISEQLTRLYAQKDATVETVFARLAPLEAQLAALDPTAALDRFAERLEAVQGRVATLETRGEPVRGDLRAADPALRPEGRDGRDGLRPAGAAGGAARRARPDGGARPLRRAAGGGAGPGGGDRERGEPVRGDLRAADPALRPEGCDGGDGLRAAGAAGGAARRARPDGGARPLRRPARGFR